MPTLKTPTAQLAVNGGSQHPDKRTAGGHGPTLADQVEHLLPTPNTMDHLPARDMEGQLTRKPGGGRPMNLREHVMDLLPTPNTMDAMEPKTREQIQAHRDEGKGGDSNLREYVLYDLEEGTWGKYAPAIARWEAITGRTAPVPTVPGQEGKPRLNPELAEWMMGLPDGWVTRVPGLTRKEQLKAIGNGVCPGQAAAALRILLRRIDGQRGRRVHAPERADAAAAGET